MNMESFLKVALILSSAIAQEITFTPPNVPLRKEIVYQTSNEWIFNLLITYGLPTLKANYWAGSFAEIATIVYRTSNFNSLSAVQAIAQYAVGLSIRNTPITISFVLGTAFAVIGCLIRRQCYRTLGRFFTFQLSVREGHHIVTTGPYAIVRHPSYTSGLMHAIGALILHGSPDSWLRHSGVLDIPGVKTVVVTWLAGIILLMTNGLFRVSEEDEMLKRTFGDEWERWAKVVRYRLIPGIY
ncbi:hypothetical protein DEU56DRAFT_72513 [Suillus clintonianus]|uniref:uncharacterized protein n=1 Tax=Suillus clintonianus TaxID=1904413 RepID=UPI001B86AAED|nr:uncharacterized protein DEU56DRAFT_72513 [Suillus clintonianus]KAG2122585.1 hypothetical protein DEU56DRAFT_72513 [Suillus clintonianus]